MSEQDPTERAAQTAWNCGAYGETTRIVFEAYGHELYSFVLAQFHGQAGVADDVFSQFSEDFWVSLVNAHHHMFQNLTRAWTFHNPGRFA